MSLCGTYDDRSVGLFPGKYFMNVARSCEVEVILITGNDK